jgi:hypothetical protein
LRKSSRDDGMFAYDYAVLRQYRVV